MSRERRIHSRVRTKIRASVLHGGESVEGVLENVGEGGVFFATEILEVLIDDGAEVVVEFSGKRGTDDVKLSVKGTVLRTERYFDGQAVVRAFAIKFNETHAAITGMTF